MEIRIGRPEAGEYAAAYQVYIDRVAHETDAIAALQRQVPSIGLLERLNPEQEAFRYAEGKWSVRQVIGHLADAERVFAYRLLRAVRGDQTPLASFDENAYVERATFDRRPVADVAGELMAVRRATLALLGSLDASSVERTTVASGHAVSVRALAFIIAGHTAHHFHLLRERYGISSIED
jgi:uncharacterized damage-inducible protein DinB